MTIRYAPSPQPSLVPVKGVRVRMNSSSVVPGWTSAPATSYRRPFSANTTFFSLTDPIVTSPVATARSTSAGRASQKWLIDVYMSEELLSLAGKDDVHLM